MSSSPNRISRVAAHAKRQQPPRRRGAPPLNAGMTCESAFRVIARRCLSEMNANHAATCRGDRAALHEMRVALTRLRAAVSFFSPMTVDTEWARLKRELRWLNAPLGAARDMDVAIERLGEMSERQPYSELEYRSWQQKCADSHRDLARVLRSQRYRQLIKDTSDWLRNGPWCTKTDKRAAKRRASRIGRYSTRKLARWRVKLLKKSRRLADMDTKQRHRLRLANKRLRYSIEFFAGLRSDESPSMRATLKHLRRAQESLGVLNDAAQSRTLWAGLDRTALNGHGSTGVLDPKHEQQLVRDAARAYRKIDALEPIWS
jgi:CHAD domain-containing protein